MLNTTNPEIMLKVASYHSGLVPTKKSPGTSLRLVIKTTKEMILTANMRQEFVFYIVPVAVDGRTTCGLITAFFDDPDEPLVIRTPLFDDKFAEDMFRILASSDFDVHFVTEDNLELMAWKCRNDGSERVKALLPKIELFPGSLELGRRLLEQMDGWFARRTSCEDRDRLVIREAKNIFTLGMIMDARPHANAYHGRKTTMHTTLERANPGEQSELDVVAMLLRVFPAQQIYLSPARPDNGREFVDVLVSTPKCLVLVQAKDSPNTPETLQRSMARKKAAVESHLKKAAAQLSGSISYIRSDEPVEVVCDGQRHIVSPEGRSVIGLIVVKELFPDEYATYSEIAFDLYGRTGVRCFTLDMMEFHSFTFHCRTEERFLDALEDVFVFAKRNGQFPRSRFGLVEWDSEVS